MRMDDGHRDAGLIHHLVKGGERSRRLG